MINNDYSFGKSQSEENIKIIIVGDYELVRKKTANVIKNVLLVPRFMMLK